MKDFLKSEYQEYKVPDFALDESFIRWVKYNDPETEKFWTEWLKNNPEKKKEIEIARNLVLALQFREEEISNRQINSEWKRLGGSSANFRRHAYDEVKRMPFISFKGFVSVAAVLLFVVAFSFILRWFTAHHVAEDNPITLVKETPKGQKLSIVLPDGTEIKLNSDSRITYPTQFTGDSREVTLEGEAYFDVVHDDQKPFKVHTGRVTTIVLGTSFNVNAYTQNPDVQVALVEGKVKVDVQSNSGSVREALLSPNEMATINKKDERLKVMHFNIEQVTGWKKGNLYFEKVAFEETLVKLERWYGVEFEIESNVKIDPDWQFSGKFRNKSLESILRVFSYPDLFKYQIKGRKVIIY